MQDYVKLFQEKVAEIEKDVQAVHIINAGIMNHGKSSVFNSLLDKEYFAVEDVRTTLEANKVLWEDNVYLVDTPGLKADNADDIEAYAAYRKANMIVFVHTVNVGELHAEELQAINTIKQLFSSDEFFWKHFCLVLTAAESEASDNLNNIKDKVLRDIEKKCGGRDFKTFMVSNIGYWKGRKEEKDKLVELSNIPELRVFLREHIKEWAAENGIIRKTRICKEQEKLLNELKREAGAIKNSMADKEKTVKNRQQVVLTRLENIIGEKKEQEKDLKTRVDRLSDMKSQLKEMKEQHKQAKDNY